MKQPQSALDEIIVRVGEFGKYQRCHYLLLACTGFLSCFSAMAYVFVAAMPNHWCAAPPAFSNLSLAQRKHLTLPVDENGEFSKCKIYNVSSTDASLTYSGVLDLNGSSYFSFENTSQIRCSKWEFDSSTFEDTAVTQWDLVCGKEWVAASIGACMGAGKLVFGLFSGILADRFGRKKILVASISIQTVVGILTAFSPEPVFFILGCAFISGFSLAAYQSAFVIGVEMVGVKWRVFAGLGCYVSWTIGYLILSLVAYFVRTWSTLQLVLHAPMVIFVVLYAWLSPESVRWLLQKDRQEEAIAILKNMAKINGKEWDDSLLLKAERKQIDPDDKVTLMSLVKSPMMLVYTLTSCYLWFSCNLLFYGLSYNTASLAGDPYVNFAISGAVEIPAHVSVYFLLSSRLGRRGTTFLSLLISTVALLLTIPIPKEFGVITTVLAMIGKCSSTATFATMFIYTPEFYPTSFRSFGISISSFVGRLGVVVAPYIALLGTTHYSGLPLIVFGLAALLATCLSVILPETKSVHLPDTMEDLKKLKKHAISCRRGPCAGNEDEETSSSNSPGEREMMIMKPFSEHTNPAEQKI